MIQRFNKIGILHRKAKKYILNIIISSSGLGCQNFLGALWLVQMGVFQIIFCVTINQKIIQHYNSVYCIASIIHLFTDPQLLKRRTNYNNALHAFTYFGHFVCDELFLTKLTERYQNCHTDKFQEPISNKGVFSNSDLVVDIWGWQIAFEGGRKLFTTFKRGLQICHA